MSHVSAGEPCINPAEFREGGIDYEALVMALKELAPEMEVVLGQKTFKWVGEWYNDYHAQDAAYKAGIDPKDYGKCEHVIRFKRDMHQDEVWAAHPDRAPNEIGLVRLPNGMLAPVFDFYGNRGGDLKRIMGGPAAPKLTQLVTQYKVVLQTARQKGHYVKDVEKLADGKVKIRIGVKKPDSF